MDKQLEEIQKIQPVDASDRYYVLERLKTLQAQIRSAAWSMVYQRALVEKYRQSDFAAARDSYAALQSKQMSLLEMFSEAALCLMEMEDLALAAIAEQLRAGLSRFDLMSCAYKPVYEAIAAFAARLPVSETASAAVVGRLMNNIKMGYYPIDPKNISLIQRGIQFPEGITTNLLDPCCGCGKALRQLAQGNNCYTYGVELDQSRAEEAQMRLHHVGFGSFFFSRISHDAFHLLFLNPPYLSVLNASGSRARHEKRFLIESLCHLTYGGLLIYVIPYYRLTPDICRILCENFTGLSVWRFTDEEFKRFKQVAVLGVRKRRETGVSDTQRLEQYALSPASIPPLSELQEGQYALPAMPLAVQVFQGERFNKKELEQQLRRCDSFKHLMSRSELDHGVKHPPLPLSISQIGLVGGSGMFNGLMACESPHIIKGRIVKVMRKESTPRFGASGNRLGTEVRETITNKMIFNVLTPKGFRSLT